MHIIAFIVALAALIAFGVDYARTKALIPLGLVLLTLAWILSLILVGGGDGVTLNT
jgi:hypothetical protein